MKLIKKFKIKFGPIKKHATKKEIKECKEKCGITNTDDILALTDDRVTKNKSILISTGIDDDKELLRVLLDEAIHACDDRIDNDIVDVYARDIANFLWRCGYRKSSKQADGLNT